MGILADAIYNNLIIPMGVVGVIWLAVYIIQWIMEEVEISRTEAKMRKLPCPNKKCDKVTSFSPSGAHFIECECGTKFCSECGGGTKMKKNKKEGYKKPYCWSCKIYLDPWRNRG